LLGRTMSPGDTALGSSVNGETGQGFEPFRGHLLERHGGHETSEEEEREEREETDSDGLISSCFLSHEPSYPR
jgi:hypothetical protein